MTGLSSAALYADLVGGLDANAPKNTEPPPLPLKEDESRDEFNLEGLIPPSSIEELPRPPLLAQAMTTSPLRPPKSPTSSTSPPSRAPSLAWRMSPKSLRPRSTSRPYR